MTKLQASFKEVQGNYKDLGPLGNFVNNHDTTRWWKLFFACRMLDHGTKMLPFGHNRVSAVSELFPVSLL